MSNRRSRKIVQSFDVFDTLITRDVLEPTEIFDRVEKAGVPSFKQIRLKAQLMSNHTLDDIYRHYQDITGIGEAEIERIKALELKAERDSVYLVQEINQRIRDGDVLVSDMYLPANHVADLLHAAGFRKSVNLYVTPSGKASGQIWPELQSKYYIAQHTGDHPHSDVASPKKHGIETEFFQAAHLSAHEQLFVRLGAPKTALLLKRFRLGNPHQAGSRAYRMHQVQALCNLPILLLLSARLRQIMQREGLSRILFSQRDGCLLHRLFASVCPDVNSQPFWCSRMAYMDADDAYQNYLKSVYIPGQSIIFDLHGAFKTGRPLFERLFGAVPRVHIFSVPTGRADIPSSITYDFSGGNSIELLNLDSAGPIIRMLENGTLVRAPITDYDVEIGNFYSQTLDRFLALLQFHIHEIRHEIATLNTGFTWGKIDAFIREIVHSDPDLSQIRPHEHQSLTMLANRLLSDKGSTYKCAHHYTKIYERLLEPFGMQNQVHLLEVGLNRDQKNTIPSLAMWRSYFGSRVTLYGMDICTHFAAHHRPEQGIHIIIGDQSVPGDLLKCISKNPAGFDIIIDDGYHATRHQQITLKTLWPTLRSGGLFIIEDLHYQPEEDASITTRDLLTAWSAGLPLSSPYINEAEARLVMKDVASIDFYDSLSTKWPAELTRNALVAIRKR